MSATLVDTSVFVALERRSLQALERISSLLEGDGVAVSAVTLAELLASPTLPGPWRTLFEAIFGSAAEVLPVSEAAARIGIDLARRVGGAKAPDVMIAGAAAVRGLDVLTADADFARLLGPAAEILRLS